MKDHPTFEDVCQMIEAIVVASGEPLEGNCVYRHNTLEKWECLANKRRNLEKAVCGRSRVCEIGFNAGHSLLTMLYANPSAEYTIFDIATHAYTRPCFSLVTGLFRKTKIAAEWGDTLSTLAAFSARVPGAVFDVFHIDGGHRSRVYGSDWSHALKMTRPGGMIIFDDTDNPKVNAIIDKSIADGHVKNAAGFIKTFGYPHRIIERL